ncbi:hypothetical protein HDU83_001379 [Entophlyctis luteolus]|nr:hypothetical protein HDU83_001379 [Entophlyctis luteolus]
MTRRSLKRGHSCATADTQAALGLEKPVRKAAKGSDSLSFVNGDTERCGDSTASSTAVKLVRYYKDELIEYGVPPQRYLGRLLCPGEFIAVYTRPEDADHVPPSVVEILTCERANAATVIQRNWRCFVARKCLNELKSLQSQRNRAACNIQKAYRQFKAAQINVRNRAARMIQNCYRSYKTKLYKERILRAVLTIQNVWRLRVTRKNLERQTLINKAATHIQSRWRMAVARQKYCKLKKLAERIQSNYRSKRKAKANLLEKLAQIQAQRQSLLQKQKEMIEGETTISASHKVQMGKDYIFKKVDASNCIRSPSTVVGDLDVVVPASPQASPKATRSKIKPQTTKSTALPDQTVSQRRLNSRSAMKNAGGEVTHSESPSVARKCHLNALTARELEKLTASNTAKNHGHVRVTLKMEIVRVNSARPPSPTADRDPTSFSDPNHPHRSLDATRHTKIQWREEASLAEEFGGPGVSTPINVQPGRCCLKKDKIRMSPRSTVFSEEVIVVKKFEYLDDAKPTQPQPQGIKGRRVVIGQRMAQRGASSNKASGGKQGRGK